MLSQRLGGDVAAPNRATLSDALREAVMLHLSGATRSAVVVFCSATVSLAAQQPAAPTFEVASIRQNVSGSGSNNFNIKGETVIDSVERPTPD
jgi:hypothetical protein